MTDEQRNLIIAKMIDSPTSLTDEQLELILHDDELRELHEVSAAISSASVGTQEPDMDEEWNRFRPRLRRKPSLLSRMMKVAAIFLGVAVGGHLLAVMIDYVLTRDEQPVLAEVEQSSPKVENPFIKEDKEDTSGADQTVAILSVRTTVQPSSVSDRDIEEFLRIQQASVDNELAMLTAELLVDELEPVRRMNELLDTEDETLEILINKITDL